MERKNIAFQYGIHRSPLAANDGELAECINLEVHNGELTASVMPQVSFSLEEGDKLLFVHKSGNYKNYIIQRGTDLCWFPDKDKEKVSVIGKITPTSIHSVGNTLVVLTGEHMEYVLYKSENYKPIGSKPPFCSISFGLFEGDRRSIFPGGEFTIEGSANDLSDAFKGFKQGIRDFVDNGVTSSVSFIDRLDEIDTDNDTSASTYVNAMTEAIIPVINKIVSDNRKFGSFTHPFFLRYAYRMYDGSHYMQSAPIFFPINMKGPVAFVTNYKDKDYDFTCMFNTSLLVASLNYRIEGFYNQEGEKVSEETLRDWSDIIKGLDIFVSQPIYPYKQDGYIYGYAGSNDIFGSSLNYTGHRFSVADPLMTVYKNHLYSDDFDRSTLAFKFESNENFEEHLDNAGQFYKISEFGGVDSLMVVLPSRTPLTIEKDILTNLEQQEVLEDDYDSHNEIIPSFAHVYNGRLNISGIRTKLFNGYPMESMLPYTYDPETKNYYWYSKTTLEIEGQEVSVVSKSNIKLREKPAFIYYPNPKVKSFTLNRYDGESGDPGLNVMTYHTATFKAEAHKLLNGSFYLSSTYGIGDTYTLTTSPGDPQPSGDPYVSYPNKIYTSEVNNPFFFPLSGRNSIGTGEIIAITSNTKAISPGQFGEYPLIVFSTDGVWAMQVGEEGLYFGVHPISKDICTNPNVLQTDGPVLFATDNGLHSIVTDTVANISKIIKGKPESVIVPEIDTTFNALYSAATDTFTLTDFIRDALFAYDYANNRAIIYNPAKDFAYSYSLESGMFSKLVLLNGENPVKMEGIVKAYPEVYMQAGTDIYTFVPDKDNTTGTSKGIIVTRTMTFADPLAMKVINDVRLIYHRSASDSKCRYAMYVSNDGYNWIQRTSLRGHSFKYFRFVVFTEMADTDALQGMSVMFDYRRTNKLR